MATEVNLPLLMGKLRNLLIEDGLCDYNKLLTDKVRICIKVLGSISASIREAEELKVRTDSIESLLSELTGSINHIEDLIDTFLVKMELRWGRKLIKMTVMRPLISFTSRQDQIDFSLEIRKLERVDDKLKGVDNELKRVDGISQSDKGLREKSYHEDLDEAYRKWIYTDAGAYPTSKRPRGWGQTYWEEEDLNSFHMDEFKNVVGFEELIEEFVARLRKVDDNPHQDIIAVTGKAGSGKTTLTKMVYNHPRIKRHFDIRVWLGYPKDAEAEDILVNIWTLVSGERANQHSTVPGMIFSLGMISEQKSCLIVIDDVRTRDNFDKLKIVLQYVSRRARVVITTRDKDGGIGASGKIIRLHLQSLTDEESWELFLKMAHIPKHRLNDSVLINLKEKILRRCDGLPQAIVILAGLLSTRDITAWSSVIEDASIEEDILAVSYQDLRPQMKPCFLYLRLFPRAFQIPVRRLLHLWLAEGLVTPLPEQNMASEDLADKYFKELIYRGMIEVARVRSDGSPKTCFMPGILWDWSSSEAVTLGLFHHNTTDYTSAEALKFNVRRLAEYVGIKSYPSIDPYIQCLRSYISFNTRKRDLPAQEIGMFLNAIVTKRGFGLLRVLDLEGVYKPMLPEILRKFLHLKYLGLRWTFLDSLPKSIGNLPYLETLDVKHTNIITLPSSIWKAKNLRHLYLNEIHFDVSLQKPRGGSLTYLRTFWGLYIGNESIVYNCLNKLTALRKLGLTFNSTSFEAIAKWISKLTNLQSLRLRSSDEFGGPGALRLGTMIGHQQLSDLYLLGDLPGTISEHQLPPNLTMLTLSASKLKQDPMPVLGQLYHLHILRLFGNSFTGERITCLPNGFPELRVLKLWMLEKLEEWIVKEGTMPRLRELEIRSCCKLKHPEGLELLTNLQDLILTNMTQDCVTNVKRVMDKRVFIKENNWSFAPLKV